ncbi:MAG: hypothetical protein ACI4AH_06980 [Muribaculaceae bacterium]
MERETIRRDAYKGLLETIPMPIAVYDKTGKCVYLNSWCKKITNYNHIDNAPNLFESRIISKKNIERLKKGKSINDSAFLNYTDETLSIFGKAINDKLAIQYDIHMLHSPQGEVMNYILAINDITCDYNQQQRSDEYLALLRDCLQLTGIGAYIYDVAEDKYYRFKGSDIVPMNFSAEYVFQHIAPQYRAQYIEMFLRIKNGEISTDRRCYALLSTSNNKYYHVETFTYGTTDVSGKVTRILQTIRNVTENQAKLIELKSIKLILGKALPIAGILAWRYDVSTHDFTRTDFANNSISTSFDELFSTIHPEDRNIFLASFEKLMHGESQSVNITVRKSAQNGKWSVIEIFAIPMLNDIGSVSAILGIICDVSETTNTENKLEDIRKKTLALVEAAKLWVFVYNSIDKSLLTYSRETGRNTDDDLDRYIAMVHPDDKKLILDLMNQVNNQQIEDFNVKIKARTSDKGEFQTIEFCGKAYDYQHGSPTHYVAFAKIVN